MPLIRPSHRPIVLFLAKMLAAYVVWYVVYDLWLLPAGHLDAIVGRSAAYWSGTLLSSVGLEPIVDGRIIRWPSGLGVWVADACTGLTTVGLFVGFVIAYPGSWKRRALFLPLGILTVHFANILRIAVLAWLREANVDLFITIHHWGGLPFYYGVVFALWMVWVHYGGYEGPPRVDDEMPSRAVPVEAAAS